MPTPLYRSTGLRRIEAKHGNLPLMQRAGTAAAEWAAQLATDCNGAILVLAGPGNNGGDAFVAATRLRQQQFDVHLVFVGPAECLTTQPVDAATACAHWQEIGGCIETEIPDRHWRLIIDGIFGIGLTRAPSGQAAEIIAAANKLSGRHRCPLLALDCPSGLDTDRGQAPGAVITASHTLTFIAAKPGLYTGDGPDCCGVIRIADLGITPLADVPADGNLIDRALFADKFVPRCKNSHKGSHGSAAIVGGADGMLGAALLAGRAALHIGCGRVHLGLLDPHAPACDPQQAELMLQNADSLLATPPALDAFAVGCGLSTSQTALRLLTDILPQSIPLVLDADALNLLAQSQEVRDLLQQRTAPTVLTPHPGEAARLLGGNTAAIAADRIGSACALATRYSSYCVLKGCGSIVASPNGGWWINTSGNPALATAGSGDVLSGILVALLAQGWPPLAATQAAVHLHGATADALVAGGEGPVGITAGEIIPAARKLLNRWLAQQINPAKL